MIILIGGGTHTGKTCLAQRLLEKYHYPYLSLDHLKMGLIRCGYSALTPESSDEELTVYLWPVAREMIKTCVENRQNLILEGCYIPFSYQEDFLTEYLKDIRFLCLVFSESYINDHFLDILGHACRIEQRLDDSYCTKELLLEENRQNLALCKKFGFPYFLIEKEYPKEIPFDL